MAIPDLVGGTLPLGRWPATVGEAAAFANLPDAVMRSAMWAEWLTLLEAVQDAVGEVAVCWLSGSFFTDKATPGDIDCVFLIRRELLIAARADADKAKFLQVVAENRVKPEFNLRIDSFLVEWWPRPGVIRGSDVRRRGYLEDRGYWDDLWSRSRDADLKADAVPRRGYLEVTIDGYR